MVEKHSTSSGVRTPSLAMESVGSLKLVGKLLHVLPAPASEELTFQAPSQVSENLKNCVCGELCANMRSGVGEG